MDGKRLEAELQAHLKQTGSDLVSRTAISNWFKKANTPGRSKPFQFLASYLSEHVEYETLSPDQKKVHTQVGHFLSTSITSIRSHEEAKGRNFLAPTPGKLGIRATSLFKAMPTKEAEKFFSTWAGTYVSYRRRLIVDKGPPIAREVIRLTRIKDQMAYEHWHWKNGSELAKFEGFLHLREDSVWLFGQSEDTTRLRICHLQLSDTENPRFSRFRWGLMHSDIPLPSSKDPASARILLVGQDRPSNFERWVTDIVRYVDDQGEMERANNWINRFIDNDLSSHSRMNSIEPEDQSDRILRVERRTVENACGNLDFQVPDPL